MKRKQKGRRLKPATHEETRAELVDVPLGPSLLGNMTTREGAMQLAALRTIADLHDRDARRESEASERKTAQYLGFVTTVLILAVVAFAAHRGFLPAVSAICLWRMQR
jgi:hypothetical protein